MNEQEIFLEARSIGDARKRLAFLKKACEGDQSMFQRVETLLELDDTDHQVLDRSPASLLQNMADRGKTQCSEDNSDNHDIVDQLQNRLAPDRQVAPTMDVGARSETEAFTGDVNNFVQEVCGLLEPSPQPGSLGRLSHYEIERVLGHGGFGVVLKAFDQRLRREVAIKVLAPSLAVTSPPRKRFLREARAVAAVRHENIVQIYAVEEEPSPYIVMEYIEGKTLQEHCDELGPFTSSEVVRLGSEIASGLAAAHDKGIVHRDIKPANILLTTGSTIHVKLTDFGLARTADDASVTHSGLISGTPMFMAPEQVTGGEIDHRADLFSFGSVLYTMCSGRPPFRAASLYEVLKRVKEDRPRPIRQVIPEIPPGLSAVIERLHQKEPADRFQSANDALTAIENCLDVTPTKVPAKLTPSYLYAGLIGFAAIALLLIASIILPLLRDKSSNRSTREANANNNALSADITSVVPAPLGPEELKEDTIHKLCNLNPGIDPAKLRFTIKDESITGLNCQPMDLLDISPLSALTELEKLELYLLHGQPVDLEPVRGMTKLKHFTSHNICLTDLSPLSDLPLEKVDIWGWASSDLSPLRGMQLKSLNCGFSKLSDISPLRGMPLEYLCLNATQVKDLTPLQGMPLKSLLVETTLVSDLSPLQGLPLDLLAIKSTQITDYSLLPKFPLKKLFMDKPEDHLELINQLPQLEVVSGKPIAEFRKSVVKQ